MTQPGLYRLGSLCPVVPRDGRFYLAPGAIVIGDVRIGRNVSIWFNAVLRGDNEPIVLGDGSNIQDGCVVHTDPGYPVEIGDNVTVGHNAIIHGCRIGDGSLVGMGATVLNGAQIGPRCLIGANSLVREGMVVPDGSLVVGVTAQIVRTLVAETTDRLALSAARYRAKSRTYCEELYTIDADRDRS